MMVAPAIAATGVAKVYVSNGKAVHAIRDASFDVPEAAFVSLIGPSGCGKSTLLKMIGGLDRPTAGELLYQGKPVDGINHNDFICLDRISHRHMDRVMNELIELIHQVDVSWFC